jgi:outer membrane protein TolC
MKKYNTAATIFCFLFLIISAGQAQQLTLKEALNKGLTNYSAIKARASYANASRATVQQSRRDYLPNLNLSAQQDYGTVNGQNGPLYGFGGFGVASSGLPLATQNWNAGFGALYLANVNWDFFAFGKAREKIKVAQSVVHRDENDLSQLQFQQQVQVAAAYLNLLASQRITLSQQKNLERAIIFKNNTVTRAKSGLIAGVDSSLAAAEVSNAKIALTRARDTEQEQSSRLALLMGVSYSEFTLDSAFINNIPKAISEPATYKKDAHPVLAYYQSRIDLSNEQAKFYSKSYFPVFSLFGIMQERGSGFTAGYTQNQHAYTTDYATGVKPTRGNYLLGVGVNWNLTTIARTGSQVKSQDFISAALKEEYNLAEQQIQSQLALSDAKIKNALANYAEAPVQVKAATEAYQQKTALYKNGLSTVVDVQQALYALNRAETDRDIAYTNVWQALLLKAAAAGEITLFTNEF